jgi:branched-chain amino acid transport system ATP-binding protein
LSTSADPGPTRVADEGRGERDEREVLRLEGIGVRFGGISALSDVSLLARAGEILGIIGPNGAGKTTLFDVIAGVRAPDTGRVFLGGTDISRVSAVGRARRGLRRTFQRVQTFGWLSVEDNVLAALEWRGGRGGFLADLVWFPPRRALERERRRRVAEVLELCGLAGIRKEPTGALPIGIARIVELARAIVDEPRLLLLDEPTSGLDRTEADRLGERITALCRETDASVLLVEHDMGFVMSTCDRIVVLDLGSVLAQGAPEEIQADAAVRAAYLGESVSSSGSQ